MNLDNDKKNTLDESQLNAVENACNRRLSIVTGGAGTGKTTIIKEIAKRLSKEGEEVELCALAGKAAARMREATGIPASTIHRLLEFRGTGFARKTLRKSTIIVDEASMVNSLIMAEIVNRNPRRLVLVGDDAQLPPVGAGQPFHDLIRICPQIVSTLTTCYRATEAIFKAALAIRNGIHPMGKDETEQEKWAMVQTGDPKQTHKIILDMVRRGDLDFQQDIILAPRNEGEDVAIESLNSDIIEIVRNTTPSTKKSKWCPGDRVINLKNNSELDIWNGTTGTVLSVHNNGDIWLETDFPVRDANNDLVSEIMVPQSFVSVNFKPAYALTVHKSQGSQYRKVVVIAQQRDAYSLLSRSLIYTAVTRAKKECLVVGELRAFFDAIRRETRTQTVMQQLAKYHR